MKKRVFIGVAWPYVNGELHIGHLAGYLLPADICARYNRLMGNEVLMVSGSDCFGTPITIEADKRGVTPKEIAEEYHSQDVHLFKDILHLTYDLYTRTDHPNHIKVTQELFLRMLKKGYILIDESKQYYSQKEKRFLPDRYVVGTCSYCKFNEARADQCDNCVKLINQGELIDAKSNLGGEPVELKESQHYFVDWPKLEPKIKKYVRTKEKLWKEWVSKETWGWLKEGLRPRAITRDMNWGVPLPVEKIPKDQLIENIQNKRFYVWFDAVTGYLSASILWGKEKRKSWKKFWYGDNLKHYYFMGKDNLVFHTIFWPGQLISYDEKIHLPDLPSINRFLSLDNQKFSKSRGVTIEIRKMVEHFGNDRVRFYLTFIMPEIKDTSFNWHDFEEKINGILVGNLGNFIHRTLSIGYQGKILKMANYQIKKEVASRVQKAFYQSEKNLQNCEFRNYLASLLSLSRFGNKYFDKQKVWILKKENTEKFKETLSQLHFIILSLGYLMLPLMPEASSELFKQLGLPQPQEWPKKAQDLERLKSLIRKINTSIKPKPLFQKVAAEDYQIFS